MKAESWTNVESVGAGDTERDLQEGCGAKSRASYCKVPTNRGQRGRVDRWRRGCGTAAGVARENSRLSVQWMNVRSMSNSREVVLPSFSSVEPGVVKALDFAGGLAGCAELSVPLKEVTRNLLKETVRNLVDLGIPSELCKIVVYTDGGAAFRPGEGAVVSWGFVAVLMCGNEAVCVIGCASGQVVLDRSHPEFLGRHQIDQQCW